MKKFFFFVPIVLLLIAACATTDESWDETEDSPPVVQDTTIVETPPKVDTLDVKIESNRKRAFEPKPASPQPKPPTIKKRVDEYSVQIGAFKTEEKAFQFAYTAKNKLNEDIYNIYDKHLGIYRILVGNFSSLEAAREFKNSVKKKFKEYHDAFVIDVRKEIKK